MNNTLDIFNPLVSKIVAGTEGKVILIHSKERKLGKTKVGTDLPKPFYLRFEQGLNAIGNIPYVALTSWSDFKKVNKQLTNPKTLDKVKELYQTIIFDTVDVAIKWCDFYVCATQGVKRINDGNEGFGLWKEYENEWFKEINALTNAGFCIYFIAHSEIATQTDPETGEEYDQLVPKGDKRTIDLICDIADFIGYVKSNGIDENGEKKLSSVYFAPTKEFLAGSRFEYMPAKLKVFSAENLQNAIKLAIEKEKAEGNQVFNFDEQKEYEVIDKYTYDEIIEKIKKLFSSLWDNHSDKISEIVEEYLGKDGKISETTKKQMPQLEMILYDLQELNSDING